MNSILSLVFIALIGNNGALPGCDGPATNCGAALLGSVQAGQREYALVAHSDDVQPNGAVYGLVYVLVVSRNDDPAGGRAGSPSPRQVDAQFTALLNSNHAPGYADEENFIFHMYRPESYKSILCHYRTDGGSFVTYDVPARFIGAITMHDRRIYYSTEHFEDNIHYVDLETGEVSFLAGSGQIATNTDFWIINDELIVTEGGDYGPTYRITRAGLEPAPDVQVSDETRQGFWLRDIIRPEAIPEPAESEWGWW